MIPLLEQTAHRTPLGIRFLDSATNRLIRGGLIVEAYPHHQNTRSARAYVTTSGLHAFSYMPGLVAYEHEDTSPTPGSRPFVVVIHDRRRRFVPVAIRVDLPLGGLPLYPPSNASSPPSATPGFLLFSSATRVRTGNLAVVRSRLIDARTGQPAAHAVLQVTWKLPRPTNRQRTWMGLADAQGDVALLFPYPPLHQPAATSPPTPRRLDTQQWDIDVQVRYAATPHPALPGTDLPELRSLLAQPVAGLLLTATSPPPSPVTTWTTQLHYGTETLLQTTGLPVLRIQPLHPSP